ncbi:MAG: hypothetical protein MUE60_16015, partial [Candidatus Eisenbacteria bacterium]|nr:hypothetical protein [Candidatus Eisenbacteria bacterium]
TYGGQFVSYAPGGTGVSGSATAGTGETYGGYFTCSSSSGTGVRGVASNTTGATCGGYFESASPVGIGVRGVISSTVGVNWGVYGESFSTQGRAVFGLASATAGETYGGYGENHSPDGVGVYGYNTSTSGQTEALFGVVESTEGRGVVGWAQATIGATRGVYGRCDSPSGYGVYYQGGINGTGLIRTVVRTSQGPTGLDVVTAAGSWVEDFGEGRLESGRAHIELDPVFLETVTIDTANLMKVFVQLEDEESPCLRIRRGFTGFDVESGTSDSAFWYRVVAKRKGFEAKRLDVCEAARTDSYLYPELREQERGEVGSRH